MRKKYIPFISIILVLSMICTPCAWAVDAQIQSSSQIVDTGVYLAWSKSTKNRMGLYYNITACTDMEIIGASKVEFYYFHNNQWHLERTMTVEEFPEMEGTNDSFWALVIERNAQYVNVPYRAIVYFYCKGPYGTSTVTHYSNTITAATYQVLDPDN